MVGKGSDGRTTLGFDEMRSKTSDFKKDVAKWVSDIEKIDLQLKAIISNLKKLPEGSQKEDLIRLLVDQGGVDPAIFDPQDRKGWSKADWIAECEHQKSEMRKWRRSGNLENAQACEAASNEANRRASLLST